MIRVHPDGALAAVTAVTLLALFLVGCGSNITGPDMDHITQPEEAGALEDQGARPPVEPLPVTPPPPPGA